MSLDTLYEVCLRTWLILSRKSMISNVLFRLIALNSCQADVAYPMTQCIFLQVTLGESYSNYPDWLWMCTVDKIPELQKYECLKFTYEIISFLSIELKLWQRRSRTDKIRVEIILKYILLFVITKSSGNDYGMRFTCWGINILICIKIYLTYF